MKALYIDCCVRGAESRSARLAEAFLEELSPEYLKMSFRISFCASCKWTK